MERLTEKVNDYWRTNDKAHIYYLDTNESVFVGNAIDRLGEFEDVLERWHIENLEGYISALIEVRNIAIEEKKTQFKRYIEEVTKREKIEQQLAELKQKMIVPKFKVGQEIYVIDDYFRVTSAIIERITIYRENSISKGETSYVHYLANLGEKYEWDERYLMLDGEDISLTKEEAEKKLAEIKGEKNE